ncbi:MAG: hypothetical protein EA361_05875 [Bacteroidetes bacterium]|nr:MAG: hypothetical protein EA361_05875 [Bacteroidota bacterium]
MKKISLIVFVVLLGMGSLKAQDYKTGIGVRGGFYSGLSIKHFISGSDAIEGVIATHYRGVVLAAMYQKHTNAFDAPGLNWYYGPGAHLGFYDRRYSPWYGSSDTGNFSTIGVLGVIGLEYKIEDLPITVGFDVTPALNLIPNVQFWIGAGVTLRYTIN